MKGIWQEWEENEARIKGRNQKPVPVISVLGTNAILLNKYL